MLLPVVAALRRHHPARARRAHVIGHDNLRHRRADASLTSFLKRSIVRWSISLGVQMSASTHLRKPSRKLAAQGEFFIALVTGFSSADREFGGNYGYAGASSRLLEPNASDSSGCATSDQLPKIEDSGSSWLKRWRSSYNLAPGVTCMIQAALIPIYRGSFPWVIRIRGHQEDDQVTSEECRRTAMHCPKPVVTSSIRPRFRRAPRERRPLRKEKTAPPRTTWQEATGQELSAYRPSHAVWNS